MQGVIILNTIPVWATYWRAGLITGLAIGLVVSLIVIWIARDPTPAACVCIYFIILLTLFGTLIGDCFHKELVEIRYEICIDDTVDFNALMDKYEFIEQRENSWIVRERIE